VAEAGTGKSHLFYEFKATLPVDCKVLEAYSVSHGKASAWLPVLELLRGYFGIREADHPATRREKIGASLAAVDSALDDTLPYLWDLLAIQTEPNPLAQMDAQIKHQRTLDAIKRMILHESLNQPVVIVSEDLHWIDAETQALLDLLADNIANARVLMLVNYRAEYRHEWANKSCYTQLRLAALDELSADGMLDSLLCLPSAHFSSEEGMDAVAAPAELVALKRLIIKKTEGNPFFIEEMLQDCSMKARWCATAPSRSRVRLRKCGCRPLCRGLSPLASIGNPLSTNNCCRHLQ
jgi:predicted ATPase